MNSGDTVRDLGAMLLSGQVEVVDCTGVLGPDTPIIQLPPDFAKPTPKVEINKISEYDDDGPFFAWNWMVLVSIRARILTRRITGLPVKIFRTGLPIRWMCSGWWRRSM